MRSLKSSHILVDTAAIAMHVQTAYGPSLRMRTLDQAASVADGVPFAENPLKTLCTFSSIHRLAQRHMRVISSPLPLH